MTINLTIIKDLKEYLELPQDDAAVEDSLHSLVNLIGIPVQLTNFGTNIQKLILVFESLGLRDEFSSAQNLLYQLRDEMRREDDDVLNFIRAENLTSKSPYSRNLFPIYNQIDRFPLDAYPDLPPFYKILFYIICLAVHLRTMKAYEASHFSEIFRNIDTLVGSLLKSKLGSKLSEINTYKQFVGFIKEHQEFISIDHKELVDYCLIAIDGSKKIIRRQLVSNREGGKKALDSSDSGSLKSRKSRLGGSRGAQRLIDSILGYDESDEKVIEVDLPSEGEDVLESESLSEENVRLYVLPELKVNGESVSKARNLYAAKRSRIHTLNRSQFLRFDWNHLSTIEHNKLVDDALAEIGRFNIDGSLGALGALFTLTVGAEVLHWSYWKLSKDLEAPYIDLDKGVFCHYCEFEEKRWIPDDSQLNKLQFKSHNHELVELPIEAHLLKVLQTLSSEEVDNIHQLLQVEPKELNKETDDWIKNSISELNTSRWFTQKRVRDYLFFEIMSKTLDEPLANHVCAQNLYEMPTGSSYATYDHAQIVDTYLSVQHPKLVFQKPNEEHRFLGSWLIPDKGFLKEFLNSLYEKYQASSSSVNKGSDLEEIIEVHNQFVDYLIFIGFIATSHRPFDDPFPRLTDFLFELNAVLITDKVIGPENETRPSYFGDVFSKCIQNYVVHLKNLKFWLGAFGFNVAAGKVLSATSFDNQLIPFVFYLSLDRNKSISFVSVSQKKLNSRMPSFGLPWNFGRHMRAYYFRKFDVPAEYISYDFGHVKPGEQPQASYSPLTLNNISDVISPAVDKLFDLFDIKVIEPMAFKQKYPASTDIPDGESAMVLGFEKRKKVRLKKQKSDKEIIKLALKEISFEELPEQLTDKKLQLAYGKILQERPNELVKTINIFTKILNSAIKKYKLDLKKPSSMYEIRIEKSAFNDNSSYLIQLAKTIQSEFYELLSTSHQIAEKTEYALQTRMLGDLVLSLIIHSYWTSKSVITNILLALSTEDYVWLEGKSAFLINLRDANDEVFKRVPIDSFSALLAIKLIEIGFPKDFDFKLWGESRAVKDKIFILDRNVSTPGGLTLKDVMSASNEIAKIKFPGIICSKLNGKSGYGSVNDAALVRILEHRKINVKEQRSVTHISELSQISEDINVDFKKVLIRQEGHSHKLKYTLGFRKELNSIFRSVKTHEKFQQNLVDSFNGRRQSNEISQIGLLICGWLISLAYQKTRKNTPLAIATIKKLFDYVSVFLCEQFIDKDIFTLSAKSLVDNYQQVVELRDVGQGTRKEGVLSFHQFLVNEFGVLKINSEEVEAVSEEYIDANYLTASEQGEIKLDLQVRDSQGDSIALFNLYCDFGLRPSEAINRSFKDLVFDKEEPYLIVKNNHLGGLKTAASKRLLPFRFTEVDLINLKGSLNSSGNDSSCIWSSPEESQELILNSMREITGDSSLSLRNLRHTCATKWLEHLRSMVMDEDNNELTEILSVEFSSTISTRRLVFLASRILGHGGPSTFLYHYAHGYEFIISELLEKGSEFVDKVAFYEGLTGIKQATLRQWKKRGEDSSSLPLIILSRVMKQNKDDSYKQVSDRY